MDRSVLLLCLLSATAGTVDVIGFLGLDGLFSAHITGNLVILAAHFVTGKFSSIAPLLSVPVFMLVLGLTTLISGKLEKSTPSLLSLLLILEITLLTGSLVLSILFGTIPDYNGFALVATGMLAVSAMAVQSASIKLAIKNAPSTVAMTNNITQLTLDLAQLAGYHHAFTEEKTIITQRAKMLFFCILGFIVGCGLGAALYEFFNLKAFLLPIGLIIFSIILAKTSNIH